MPSTCTPRIETPHRLLLPSAFTLTGGGLMHSAVAKPPEAQLKRVVAERTGSQTSKANNAALESGRQKAGAGEQGVGRANEGG